MEAEKAINQYVCSSCRHAMTTRNAVEGVTPMFATCPECGGDAASRMYRVPQDLTPTHEWYRPDDEELAAEVEASLEVQRKMNVEPDREATLESFRYHLDNGGLLLRPVPS